MKRSIKKLDLSKATASLSDAAQSLEGVALVLTHKGKPVAALIPVEGVDWESLTVGTSPDFIDLIERSRRNYRERGGYSSEEIRQEFGLPPYDPQRGKANGRKTKPGSVGAKTGSRKRKVGN